MVDCFVSCCASPLERCVRGCLRGVARRRHAQEWQVLDQSAEISDDGDGEAIDPAQELRVKQLHWVQQMWWVQQLEKQTDAMLTCSVRCRLRARIVCSTALWLLAAALFFRLAKTLSPDDVIQRECVDYPSDTSSGSDDSGTIEGFAGLVWCIMVLGACCAVRAIMKMARLGSDSAHSRDGDGVPTFCCVATAKGDEHGTEVCTWCGVAVAVFAVANVAVPLSAWVYGWRSVTRVCEGFGGRAHDYSPPAWLWASLLLLVVYCCCRPCVRQLYMSELHELEEQARDPERYARRQELTAERERLQTEVSDLRRRKTKAEAKLNSPKVAVGSEKQIALTVEVHQLRDALAEAEARQNEINEIADSLQSLSVAVDQQPNAQSEP